MRRRAAAGVALLALPLTLPVGAGATRAAPTDPGASVGAPAVRPARGGPGAARPSRATARDTTTDEPARTRRGDHARTLRMRAPGLARGGTPDRALAELARSALLEPDDPAAWSLMTATFRRMERTEAVRAARRIRDSVLRRSPAAVSGIEVRPAGGDTRVRIRIGDAASWRLARLPGGEKPRAFVDVEGARFALPRVRFPVDRGTVERIRAAERSDGRIRIVLDLASAAPVRGSREGGVVELTIEGDAGGFPAWRAGVMSAPPPPTGGTSSPGKAPSTQAESGGPGVAAGSEAGTGRSGGGEGGAGAAAAGRPGPDRDEAPVGRPVLGELPFGGTGPGGAPVGTTDGDRAGASAGGDGDGAGPLAAAGELAARITSWLSSPAARLPLYAGLLAAAFLAAVALLRRLRRGGASAGRRGGADTEGAVRGRGRPSGRRSADGAVATGPRAGARGGGAERSAALEEARRRLRSGEPEWRVARRTGVARDLLELAADGDRTTLPDPANSSAGRAGG